jgi:hypothetical protein
MVDALGELRFKIKEEKKEEKELLEELKVYFNETEKANLEGRNYNATYDFHEKSVIDWRAIAMELGAAKKIIQKHTKKVEVERLFVTEK